MPKFKKSYSESIEELEKLLEQLEKNEIPLEELSEVVKKATDLIHQCQKQLFETDSEIQKLFEDIG
ncbi:exodeoxyribonuclease VII small subunit [Microbacter margulisiae]|uniref:Exodeoxyribonuclease VII small subunit n=1 Tax=Microbacter margulisiae TaxID=1350067 RepID=A0A7W5DPN2_9PORP|nr:exodeoxyribonuclease VII small subunit [Microbacter margulisiae]MBB3186443.1 exodeoxyribonuclease VII small subunit [Microbacter margulisiae]